MVYSQFAPLSIRLSNQLAPHKYGGELVFNVTSQTFGGYLLVPGTKLNKQQLTTAKVSIGQSWKYGDALVWWCPTWGELTLGRSDWLPFDAHCCHVGTAIKHPVPDRVKPSFLIFDIRVLWASECPDVKNYKWRLNPVWHRMLYSCTHMATVGVKGLNASSSSCVCRSWYGWFGGQLGSHEMMIPDVSRVSRRQFMGLIDNVDFIKSYFNRPRVTSRSVLLSVSHWLTCSIPLLFSCLTLSNIVYHFYTITVFCRNSLYLSV